MKKELYMSTTSYPLRNQIKVPLRLSDGNGSKPGDKLYIIDVGKESNINDGDYSIFFKIWMTMLIFLTTAVIVLMVIYFRSSSGTIGTDFDTVMPELLTEDYEGKEWETIFDRKQHNVLLIVTDDAGWADFGSYGMKDRFTSLMTPTLDRFMGQGITFKNFHTQPVCTPARGSLFTGRWTWAIGMQGVTSLMDCQSGHLPEEIPTWAELLAERGYTNHFIGKWNIGCDSWLATPLGRGFDSFVGALNHPDGLNRGGGGVWISDSGSCDVADADVTHTVDVYEKCLASCFGYNYATYDNMECKCYTDGCDLSFSVADQEEVNYTLYNWQTENSLDWFDNTEGGDPQVGTAEDDVMMQRAKDKLEELSQQDLPWTLTIAFKTPHADNAHLPNGTMTQVAEGCSRYFEEFGKMYSYNRGVICQKMNDLDMRVHKLIIKLQKLSLWNDTLVIIVNDNGGDPWPTTTNNNPNYGLNWPYRGGKFSFFEGGIRTVLALGGGALPEKYRQRENHEIHDIVDVGATILAAGGFSNEEIAAKNIDGFPLIDISSANYQTHDVLYHSMPTFVSEVVSSNTSVINWKGMKYVGLNSFMTYFHGSWVTLPSAKSIRTELANSFDCSADGCLYNLSSDAYEMTDVSKEDPDVITAFLYRIESVIKDDAFNDGIVYRTETELCGTNSSYTWLSFGNRSYFYNYPWLDTPVVLDEPRRIRDMHRNSFVEAKRRRRINLQQKKSFKI